MTLTLTLDFFVIQKLIKRAVVRAILTVALKSTKKPRFPTMGGYYGGSMNFDTSKGIGVVNETTP